MAFAAIPNVKPTTDIVLVSGYALGGAPGFVVGAVSALASNFFFGQGPWTPWQMVGWGLTGVIGAALAVITRRRIGRWPLALVCFVVGFAFTVLQDVGDWVTYSDHSVAQLWVYVGKGVGFDLIHATGCLLFALAFGPALMRSLQRFRLRLQVTWRTPDGALAPALLAVALLGAGGFASARRRRAARRLARAAVSPAGYLLSAQNTDGGFGEARGSASSTLFTGWAALGLAAAGYDPATRQCSAAAARSATTSSKPPPPPPTPARWSGRSSPCARPAKRRRCRRPRSARRSSGTTSPATGAVSQQTNWTAFAVLALRAAGAAPAPATIAWLARQQDADGGFNFATAPGASDVDDTGAALEALAGTGHAADGRPRGRVHPRPAEPGRRLPVADRGLLQRPIDRLRGAGADRGRRRSGSVHRRGGRSPIAYLNSLIAPDGHVRYAAGRQRHARLGDRRGADGAGRQAAAARAGSGQARDAARSAAARSSSPRRRQPAGSRRRHRGGPDRGVRNPRGHGSWRQRARAAIAELSLVLPLVLKPLGLW